MGAAAGRCVVALEQAKRDGDGGQHQLNGLFAHQLGVLRRNRRADRKDADRHHQDQPALEDIAVRLAAHQTAQAVEKMDRANAGDRELERAEEGGELDQADRPEAEMAADGKHELRTPDVFQAVVRRGQYAQAVEAPEQGEIERYDHDHGDGRAGELTHGILLGQETTRIRFKCEFQSKPKLYLTA